jgi:hypothetical protein
VGILVISGEIAGEGEVLGANKQKVDRVEGNWEDGMRIEIKRERQIARSG